MKLFFQKLARRHYCVVASTLVLILLSAHVQATDTDRWRISGTENATINHGDWQKILNTYIEVSEAHSQAPSINLFRYADVSIQDKRILRRYLDYLKSIDPLVYNKAEQFAYWVNLYNALTVDLILKNYPVKSITKLGSLFSFGPWDKDAVEVNGEMLTLNDIEHSILRPIWNDPRIHYAVNCASFSCPNLFDKAFTADNTEVLLELAAKSYVNHPRGVNFSGKKLILSKIYKWYADDFGGSRENLLAHLTRYTEPELTEKLNMFNGNISYEYDWGLNEPKSIKAVKKP